MIMPRGDGTGPTGRGPMSGRGMGFCVRTFETGETSYIGGGIRRGFRRWFGRGCAVMNASTENKKEFLEDEKNFLQKRLESLEKELEKMN
ncbi:MAG: DUF5320 domain-containing protein [Synergistaceae bacterium]|nr:DUF5320 domain-containing protein [Synergistaceae bacterium]